MNSPHGTSLSRLQYAFLKARLSMPSDAAALSSLGLNASKLKQWKRSPRFRSLLQLVRAEPLAAVRELALSQSELYLDALEWLFKSGKVAGVKAAIDSFHTLMRMKEGGGKDDEGVKNIFNILQLRGPLPAAAALMSPGHVVEGEVVGD